MRIAGVNHFTWMLKAEYEGQNLLPKIAEWLRQDAAKEDTGGDTGAKAIYNSAISHQLYEIFGYVPVCVAHTKEYLPYWQGHGTRKDVIPPLSIWETEARYDRHEAMWQQVDDFVQGRTAIGEYMNVMGPDHATDIIENMVGNLGRPFYINSANRGAVTNMADDAFLELLCDVDMNGPVPRAVGEMPRGLLGLQQTVLDTHELTVEAIVNCDRQLLRRAMLVDPIVNSIADADAIIAELFELERDVLPSCWFD
jgi:alpha-galactosidase